jgi:hypothetical protein
MKADGGEPREPRNRPIRVSTSTQAGAIPGERRNGGATMRRAMRWAIGLCGLGAAAAFAASPDLRTLVVAQLRAIGEPLFDRGAATEPRFDPFYADMVESLPPQQKVEQALELAINRRVGATDYIVQNAQRWRGTFEPSEKLAMLIRLSGDAPPVG